MSPRVYVSRDIAVTTAQEDTPVSIRIQLSAATVKALHARLQQAYLKDDVRLVRRTTVLIDLLVHHVAMAVLCERWAFSQKTQTHVFPSVYGPAIAAQRLD